MINWENIFKTMMDDWEGRTIQLGRTKSVHEHAVYQLLATARGWGAWRNFLPDRLCNSKLLLTRVFKVLRQVRLLPAHMRPVHPTWERAMKIVFGLLHPSCKLRHLMMSYPALHQSKDPRVQNQHEDGLTAPVGHHWCWKQVCSSLEKVSITASCK